MIGCGSESGLAPVKGRVLMNGQPLAGAAVMFHPAGGGTPATGVTDSNGDFEMETSQVKGASLSVAAAKARNVVKVNLAWLMLLLPIAGLGFVTRKVYLKRRAA